MDPLKIEFQDVPATPGAVILRFEGALESETIYIIKKTFDSLRTDKYTFVVADMSFVTKISSAALGELMGGRKRLVEFGGDLVLAGVIFDIRTKLNLMGATKIFRIFSDVRTAFNTYKWENEKKAEHVDLSFPSNLKIVPPVRQLVSRIAKQKGYGNRDSFRIETIVDEICNNAVEHGLDNGNACIDLKFKIDPDKVEIDVINLCDPEKISSLQTLLDSDEDPNTQIGEKRGRGLMLIKMLTDELIVNTSKQGTVVHVKKVREE